LAGATALFVVENGPAEIFCISGFDLAPVVMSDRYLDLVGKLGAGVRPPFDERSSHQLVYESLLLAIAEMALSHGREDFAVAMFLKSAKEKRIFLPRETGIFRQLGRGEPISEAGMVFLFFGFLHEVGHAYFARKARLRASWVQDLAVFYAPAVEALIARDSISSPETKNEYREMAKKPGYVLSPLTLAEEVWADAFATREMCLVAPWLSAFANSQGEGLDIFSIAEEVMGVSRLISTIEFGRIVAKLSREGEFSPRVAGDRWNAFSIAFEYRQSWITRTLMETLISMKDQQKADVSNEFIFEKMALISHAVMLNHGPMTRTMKLVSDAASAMSKPESWKQLLNDASSNWENQVPLPLEARAFIEIANAIGKSGPVLAALGKCLATERSR
jgi:hypothetical protein